MAPYSALFIWQAVLNAVTYVAWPTSCGQRYLANALSHNRSWLPQKVGTADVDPIMSCRIAVPVKGFKGTGGCGWS